MPTHHSEPKRGNFPIAIASAEKKKPQLAAVPVHSAFPTTLNDGLQLGNTTNSSHAFTID